MSLPSSDAVVNVEVLKLLLQVAWADDVLAPEEREAVVRLGESWRVPPETLAWLLQHLDAGRPLPQPNLALLREHHRAVVQAAEWFIGADGVVTDAEKDFVATVRELLGD